MNQLIEKREMVLDRREKLKAAAVERRSSASDRRANQESADQASQLIGRISSESKKAVMGESLALYLMRHDLMGALWSPQHLACILYHFEHYSGIRQSVTGASKLFNTLHRIAFQDYKTLSFDGIEITDRAEFLAHLDAKIAAKYGPHFQAQVKLHGLTAEPDHLQFIESQWQYLQARRGQDIPM